MFHLELPWRVAKGAVSAATYRNQSDDVNLPVPLGHPYGARAIAPGKNVRFGHVAKRPPARSRDVY